jgi:hypothetical protein
MVLSDVAGQALLNRVVPGAEIGPVTGVMEGGKLLFEGSGSLIAPALIALLGVRGALIAAGLTVSAAVLAGRSAFFGIDRRGLGRIELLELVAGVPLFSPLRVVALEAVVAQLSSVDVPAGTEVIRQDVIDDGGWFVIESGAFDVLVDGYLINELGPGEHFGELALIRHTPAARRSARAPRRRCARSTGRHSSAP